MTMLRRSETAKERTEGMRGPLSILLVSLIVSAGAPCGCRRSRPASPPVFFSIEYKDKANPLDCFPLAVGTKWTYASTDRWGVGFGGSIMTIKWITEHVITGAYDIPGGKVFLGEFIIRDVRYDDPPDASEIQLNWYRHIPGLGPAGLRLKNYSVAGNYVFVFPDQGWDAVAKGLSTSHGEELSWGEPILFFPLDGAHCWSDRASEERDYQAGLLWKAGKGAPPNPSTYYWIVNGREDVEVPYGKVRDAMKLTYTTNGGTSTVWVKEGLGFIKAGFIHGGSYNECETTLVDYSSATAPE